MIDKTKRDYVYQEGHRGCTSRYTLPCGCVIVTYSSPEIPFGRSATEKYCGKHKPKRRQ